MKKENRMLLTKFFSRILLCAVPIAFTAIVPAYSQTPALVSHRAVYDLTLAEVEEGGGVQSARGRIVMEYENSCAGNIVNQRMLVEIGNAGGGHVISDYSLSTVEDLNGEQMRFSVSNSINGEVVKKSDGIADLTGSEGIVTFQNGEEGQLSLPKEVIFPTAHTIKILTAAGAGKKLISAKVFDGNGRDGLQDSLTIIGKKSVQTSEVLEKNGMGNASAWAVQMSFFDLASQSNEPDYVVKFKMFENGVGSDLHLKYKDFSMKGTLVQLNLNKEKRCK